VAIAAVKGDRTLVQLAELFDVHLNQISTWKDQVLERATEVFATSSSARPALRRRSSFRSRSRPI
jgi:transposase